LRANTELIYSCQGKVDISFSGYDDDPRELFEISEVKEYISSLYPVLYDLFFFVRTETESPTLQVFASCVCDATWLRPQWVEFDIEKLVAFFETHWGGLNQLTEGLGMPIEDNKKITYSIFRRLGIDADQLEKDNRQ